MKIASASAFTLALALGVSLPLRAWADGTDATAPPAPPRSLPSTPPDPAGAADSAEPAAPTSTTTTTAAFTTGPSSSTVHDLPTIETESPINRALMVTGLVLFAGSYATAAGVAYASSRPEDQKNLYIPIVGPWVDIAQRDCVARPCTQQSLDTALLAVDGVVQGLGALGVLTSLFVPEKTTRHWYLIGDAVQVAPTRVGILGYGLGASGKF
jgi:hypothetical protein